MSNTQNLFSQPTFPLPYPGQSFFGSGNIQIYAQSGTYIVPPGVTRIRVRVWGAGGSGGVCCDSSAQIALTAAGGGGGGHGIKVIDTTPGTSYAVTVGAGGAPNRQVGNGATAGNPGGTSSFGTAVTCTGGGGGGIVAPGVGGGSATGGAGGTSTGGDVNYSGGAGGNAQTIATLYNVGTYLQAAGGGGSAGSIFGNGYVGGSAITTINGDSAIGAGGGAGVGGKGGSVTNTSSTSYGGAGGTFGPGQDDGGSSAAGGAGFTFPFTRFTDRAPASNTINKASMPGETRNVTYYLVPQSTTGTAAQMGAHPDNAVNRFPGDILISMASSSSTSSTNDWFEGQGCGGSFRTSNGFLYAGVFGGGYGAVTRTSTSSGGCGGIAGGGGGCAVNNTNLSSGGGGQGMVIVEW